MKVTKLSSETKAIFSEMGDRRKRLDQLMRQFAESEPTDTQTVAKIHAQVKQILPKNAV